MNSPQHADGPIERHRDPETAVSPNPARANTIPTVFLLGAALGYMVWWKRDIRISVDLHVFANVLVRVTTLMAALTM